MFRELTGLDGFAAMMVDGALTTITLSLTALAVGLVFSIILAGMKLSRFAFLRWPAEIWTLVVRGLPELLVILFIYFVIPILINELILIPNGFEHIALNSFVAGVLALSIDFSAYASETFRSVFLNFPKGQIEAGKACGMNSRQIFFRIVVPQIWAPAIPPLSNLWMVLIKASALVSAIGLEETMRVADIARNVTQQPFVWYGSAALVFLIFTFLSEIIQKRLEKWSTRYIRKAL